MYYLIRSIGTIVRFLYLPNPFQTFKNGFLINIFVEPFIHLITFMTVGIFYTSGESPTIGSLLYLFFYSVHIGLILLWATVGGGIFVGVLIVILYYSILIGIKIRMNLFY